VRVLYTAVATAVGDGRNGRATSSDGQLDVRLAAPMELGGGGGATNPEQLFAAGFAACFHSALRLAGKRAKADVSGSRVTARVGIGPNDSRGFGLTTTIDVVLPAVPEADAQRLVAAAHEICPYSNATKGNLDVQINVVHCAQALAA
jgi:lipoyl-dependent peroxiredoxin